MSEPTSKSRKTLDYAAPGQAKASRGFGVAVVCWLLICFGLAAVSIGIYGVFYTFFYALRNDRAGDMQEAIAFLALGCVCCFVAFRWSRPRK